MQRVPEPILMTDAEQCSAFNSAPRKILRDIFLEYVDKLITIEKNTIDLGCGPADYIIELCKKNKSVKIRGIDGSAEMIKIAQKAVNESNLSHRITLKEIRIEDIQESFDTVLSANTLHHTHNPDIFWSAVKRIAKKNIFVLDLLRPATNEDVEIILKTHALNEKLCYQNDFRASLKAAFSIEEIKDQLIKNNLENLKIKNLDNKIVIIYGVVDN